MFSGFPIALHTPACSSVRTALLSAERRGASRAIAPIISYQVPSVPHALQLLYRHRELHQQRSPGGANKETNSNPQPLCANAVFTTSSNPAFLHAIQPSSSVLRQEHSSSTFSAELFLTGTIYTKHRCNLLSFVSKTFFVSIQY